MVPNKNSLFFCVLLLCFASISCKKEEQVGPTYNYQIYLDKQARFVKIVCSGWDFFTMNFEYSDTIIVIKKTSLDGTWNVSRTYYLNDSGLADSMVETNQGMRTQRRFSYTSDGYLESDGWNHYEYAGGNRVKEPDPSYGGPLSYVGKYSVFSTLPNKIDIEEFNGTYLGKLNANLVSKVTYREMHAGDSHSIEYVYALNSDDYVIQRIETKNGPRNNPTETQICNFEYIFI